MKTKTLKLLGCAVLSGLFAFVSQAQSVSSTPVGYVTLTINGDGYTALSNPLENAVVYSGTASSVSGATITASFSMTNSELAGTDFQGNSTHYIQTSSGVIIDIVGNDTTSITAANDLSGLVASSDEIHIKKYNTVSDLLSSDNSIGLTSGGASNSDLVYLMSTDGAGEYTTLYYQTDNLGFLGGNGWRSISTGAFVDASNAIIAPDDGIIVRRISSGDLSVVVTGTVNTIAHSKSLPQGFSLVSYPFPVATALNNSGIYSAGNGYVSASASNSDLVYVITLEGNFTTYYYQTDNLGFLGGNGWRSLASGPFVDVGNTEIPVGSSIIVKHIGSGLEWEDAIPYVL
jgi:uncharacterized protein (TIGR02597 family)